MRPAPTGSAALALLSRWLSSGFWLWCCCLLRGQDLAPAGIINNAIDKQHAVFVVQEEPRVQRYAEGVRKQFFASARLLTAAEAVGSVPKDADLVVYGTPDSPWLAALAVRLPFRFGEGEVE